MPVIVYYGNEGYLIENAVHKLRQSVVDPAFTDLCHKIYSKPSMAKTLEAIGSVSLALGGKTLVEIHDFQWLAQASKESIIEKQLEELKHLLENIEPSKTVLFCSIQIDGKIRFSKWLLKHPKFTIQKFESFKFWETEKVADFLVQDTLNKGGILNIEAAEMLVNSIGTDLYILTNEIEKLRLYAPDRPIVKDDVMKLSDHSDNLFSMINRWILGESPVENFRNLNEILLRRHSVEVFAMMQSYFNNIFRVIFMHRNGKNVDAIANATGQKPFTIKKHLNSFQSISVERLLKLKHLMLEMEWKTKTGQTDGHLALEILLGA